MKTTIKLPISSSSKILVNIGDNIGPDTTLAETEIAASEKTIQLAYLLHVNASHIAKYLKKNLGDSIKSGEILAEKKGLFSSSKINSPHDGKIKEIDLKKGTLTLFSYSASSDITKTTVPFSGRVTGIGKGYVEIEINGRFFRAIKGEGKNVSGKLVHLSSDKVGILEVDKDVDDSILMARSFTEEAVVKLEVLGSNGFILQKKTGDMTLPWVQVDEETFTALAGYTNKKVWLRPEERQIVILE